MSCWVGSSHESKLHWQAYWLLTMELFIPGSWTDFSPLPRFYVIKTKFSINKVYWSGKWVDPLSDQTTHIGEIKKNLTHLPKQPQLSGQSVPYNQSLSYIGIFERTFSEILLMRHSEIFLLCFGIAAYN